MTDEKPTSTAEMSSKEFLERCPPGRWIRITDLATLTATSMTWRSTAPDLELYCPTCDGIRFFSAPSGAFSGYIFLSYTCRNCNRMSRTFAVLIRRDKTPMTPTGEAFKFGESPPFGPHTPSRVITLIKPDLDLFLKGRRAESQGMGIGAFAYYRRVVENQKNRPLDEIIRASQRAGADPAVLALLDSAKGETQFGKAVDMVKDAVPQALKIDNHNPLTLLHAALSKGLHGQTDDACLELATDIRIVLTDLAERLEQATRDDEELKRAVSRLHREASEQGMHKNE